MSVVFKIRPYFFAPTLSGIPDNCAEFALFHADSASYALRVIDNSLAFLD